MGRARFQIPDKDPNRPKVPEVSRMVAEYLRKPENLSGGQCHVVLDDGNLDIGHLEGDLENCLQNDDDDGAAIMRAMLQMTRTQRQKVYRRSWRYGQ